MRLRQDLGGAGALNLQRVRRKNRDRRRSRQGFLYSLLRLLPVRDLNSSAPAKRSVVRPLLAAHTRPNGEWERRRLLLLLNVIAKCPEALICDLGQRDAVDLID